MMRGWLRIFEQRASLLAASVGWLASVVLLWFRLPFGVSHGDEAFYSAMPAAILNGNRPWRDELAIHQNAGLLLVPFYKAYSLAVGSLDGIILFNRRLYFVVAVLSSIMTYRFAQRLTSKSCACWAAALVVPFSYFNLFALSYNTQGAFGMLCGILWIAAGLLDARPARRVFVGTVFLVAAVFSYVGLIAAVVPYGVLVLLWVFKKLTSSARRSALAGLGGALALAVSVAVPIGLWIGVDGFRRLLAFQTSLGYIATGVLAKFDFYHSPAWQWRWSVSMFAALFVLAPAVCSWLKRTPALAAFALLSVFYVLLCYWQGNTIPAASGSSFYLLATLTLAPACVALNREWQRGRFVLQLLWAPSVLCMLATTYSSANGLTAMSLGALPAEVAGAVCFGALVDARVRANPGARVGYELVLGALFAALVGLQVKCIYNDAYDVTTSRSALVARVHSGPFRGAYTTLEEATFTEAVDRDLKLAAKGAQTLTVFDVYTTGYLSTQLRPRTWCAWITWSATPTFTKRMVHETFDAPGGLPDVVLEVHPDKLGRRYWRKYAKQYRVVFDDPRLGYKILRRKALSAL
jgi:hypothetical protein